MLKKRTNDQTKEKEKSWTRDRWCLIHKSSYKKRSANCCLRLCFVFFEHSNI